MDECLFKVCEFLEPHEYLVFGLLLLSRDTETLLTTE